MTYTAGRQRRLAQARAGWRVKRRAKECIEIARMTGKAREIRCTQISEQSPNVRTERAGRE